MRNGGGSAIERIKVVIADMPGLLAAVVQRAVEVEVDMEIVAQIETPAALAQAMTRPVDVIVTAAHRGELAPHLRAALFCKQPIPVVAISADGSSIDVYGRWATHGYGVAGLIGLIRQAVTDCHPGCGS